MRHNLPSGYPARASLLTVALMSLGLIPAAGLQAQGYDFAGGLRVGHSGGLTAAVRYAKRATAEVQATTGLLRPGTTVTLLARQHLPLVIKRVNVYVGAGVHKGWDFEHRSGSDESGPLTVSRSARCGACRARTWRPSRR